MKKGSPDIETSPVMEDLSAGVGVATPGSPDDGIVVERQEVEEGKKWSDWNWVDEDMKEEEVVIVDDSHMDEASSDEDQEADEDDGWEVSNIPEAAEPPGGLSGLFYHTPDGAPAYATFDGDHHVLPDPKLSFLPESVAVKASAGGLLCCRGRDSLRYYVCNPLSGEWAAIPAPNKDHAIEVAVVLVLEEQQETEADGEYYLVCAYQIKDFDSIFGGSEDWGVYGFESFSSRRWEWESSASIIDGKHILPSSGVAAAGAAHWRTTIETVVSYIPTVDVYRETERPAKYTREVTWELGELWGKLCCTSLLGTTAVVQVLQAEDEDDDGDREKWKEVARLEVGSDETAVMVEEWPWPVRSQGGQELLFWEWHGLWLVARDVASGTARRLVYNAPTPGYYNEFVPYTISLVHLKRAKFAVAWNQPEASDSDVE